MGMEGESLMHAAASGCYEAGRAAALSGVPRTTVYWWARHGIVVPSVSPTREKLWSYSDLMALRIVSWLRRPKGSSADRHLPASPMPQVRRALALLAELDLKVWETDDATQSPLLVDLSGEIFVRVHDQIHDLRGQPALLSEPSLALTAPFLEAGENGPDLIRPRPHLRIIPAKVTGEPHVQHSRITTQTLAALAGRGFTPKQIATMYEIDVEAVEEGIDLERQLAHVTIAA